LPSASYSSGMLLLMKEQQESALAVRAEGELRELDETS
jgi:hypothetical protein